MAKTGWDEGGEGEASGAPEGVCGPDERDRDLSWEAPGLLEDHVPRKEARLWAVGGILVLLGALAAVILPLLLVVSR